MFFISLIIFFYFLSIGTVNFNFGVVSSATFRLTSNPAVNLYQPSIFNTLILNSTGLLYLYNNRTTVSQLSLVGSAPYIFFQSTATMIGMMEVSNTFLWSTTGASYLSGTAFSGQLNLLSTCVSNLTSTVPTYVRNAVLNNFGSMTFAPVGAQYLYFDNTASRSQFVNRAGANLTLATSGSFFANSVALTGWFSNLGNVIVNLPLPTASFFMNMLFDNSGSVSVSSGYFSMSYTGNHNGTFTHCSSCRILFAGGAHVLSSASDVEDGVGIFFTGATTTINGTFAPTFFTHTAGVTTFNIPFTTAQNIDVQAGMRAFFIILF